MRIKGYLLTIESCENIFLPLHGVISQHLFNAQDVILFTFSLMCCCLLSGMYKYLLILYKKEFLRTSRDGSPIHFFLKTIHPQTSVLS